MGDKRWYVVHAYSGQEKSIQAALIDRIKRSGMADKFGQVMVPRGVTPVAQAVERLWLPHDRRHPGEEALRLPVQPLFPQLRVQLSVKAGQMRRVEGGIVELSLGEGADIPS